MSERSWLFLPFHENLAGGEEMLEMLEVRRRVMEGERR